MTQKADMSWLKEFNLVDAVIRIGGGIAFLKFLGENYTVTPGNVITNAVSWMIGFYVILWIFKPAIKAYSEFSDVMTTQANKIESKDKKKRIEGWIALGIWALHK